MNNLEIAIRDMIVLRKAGFQYFGNFGTYVIYKSNDLNLLIHQDYNKNTALVTPVSNSMLENMLKIYGGRLK